jgi:hypothetical protein
VQGGNADKQMLLLSALMMMFVSTFQQMSFFASGEADLPASCASKPELLMHPQGSATT